MKMIKEHERIVLTTSVPAEGLEAGDVGTVVHVYKDDQAYEVEFVTLDGHTAAVVTLEASQVELPPFSWTPQTRYSSRNHEVSRWPHARPTRSTLSSTP